MDKEKKKNLHEGLGPVSKPFSCVFGKALATDPEPTTDVSHKLSGRFTSRGRVLPDRDICL